MNRRPPPPVGVGPYIDPWPKADSPQMRRPDPASFVIGAGPGGSGPVPNLNFSGSAGAIVPPGSMSIYDLSQFVTINGSKPFAVPTTSTKLVNQPPSFRTYLHLRNASGAGGANIFVEFGADAVADSAGIAGSGVRLEPNEQILWDAKIPQDDIYAIASAAGALLVISYSVIVITP